VVIGRERRMFGLSLLKNSLDLQKGCRFAGLNGYTAVFVFAGSRYDVQVLVSNLAEEQGYKCALCSQNRNLEIEHDHDPEYGTGETLTIYNIRGLVCRGCNWHIMMYERNNNGEFISFGEASSRLSDYEWEKYIYPYERRVFALNEERLEREMGFQKYWRRRNLLDKFDGWKDWGPRRRTYPWYWGFDEIKERKRNTIRTPEQFFKVLAALLEYLKDQVAKDPEWMPPEEMMPGLLRLKSFLDELWPIVEARLLEVGNVVPAVADCARPVEG
jgi:hypothetical protein